MARKSVTSMIKGVVPGKVRRFVNRKLLRPHYPWIFDSLLGAEKMCLNVQQKLYHRTMASLLEVDQWCVDSVQVFDNRIEVDGWALPFQGNHALAGFMLNGKEFDVVWYPQFREDLGRVFWYVPNSAMSKYTCRAWIDRKEAFANGHLTIQYLNKKTGQPLPEEYSFYYPDIVDDGIPLPEPERRKRVHGNDLEATFRAEGYSCYHKLANVLKKHFGKDYSSCGRILDWGVGCGRLSRYFRNLEPGRLTGVDVDADNVNWCREHLPFGSFHTIPLHPQTALAAGSFDLLIGISIFTHLKERDQFEWLEELRRVAADGAILLMTVMSNTAICRGNLPREVFWAWRKTGYFDCSSADLNGHIADADYYRNTFHTRGYLRKNWSKYFQIVDIIPGCIGNHQDLVVMRKVS